MAGKRVYIVTVETRDVNQLRFSSWKQYLGIVKLTDFLSTDFSCQCPYQARLEGIIRTQNAGEVWKQRHEVKEDNNNINKNDNTDIMMVVMMIATKRNKNLGYLIFRTFVLYPKKALITLALDILTAQKKREREYFTR